MKESGDSSAGLLIIWEYQVRRDSRTKFESTYAPKGPWAALFRKGEGYIRTEFWRDPQNELGYCTLDFWTCRAAYEAFKEQHASEYKIIDQQCEFLTEKETLIGYFEAVPSAGE
jgi:heme-degrading monooxygenase HmoA